MSRYIESKRTVFEKYAKKDSLDAANDKNWNSFLETSFDEDTFSMYELYRKIAAYFAIEELNIEKLNIEFFEKLKNVIKQLVKVNPQDRINLKTAQKELSELEEITKKSEFENFLKFDEIIKTQQDNIQSLSRENPTEISYGLMLGLQSDILLTMSSTGLHRKLTQRNTRLCATFSSVILLYDALNQYFKKHNIPNMKIDQWKVDDEIPSFIAQTIAIVCFVISPRSLNGLNNCHRDEKYQIVAQEQNIGK